MRPLLAVSILMFFADLGCAQKPLAITNPIGENQALLLWEARHKDTSQSRELGSDEECRNAVRVQTVTCSGFQCSASYSGGCDLTTERSGSSEQRDCNIGTTITTCYYDVVCCKRQSPTPRPPTQPPPTRRPPTQPPPTPRPPTRRPPTARPPTGKPPSPTLRPPTPTKICEFNSDCGDGAYCGTEVRECIRQAGDPEPKICEFNSDCGDGAYCDAEFGVCIPQTEVQEPECLDDKGCSDNVPCTVDVCADDFKCYNAATDELCDSGFRCDIDLGCVPEAKRDCTLNADCNDNISCTADLCRDDSKCYNYPTDDLCDSGFYCDASQGCLEEVEGTSETAVAFGNAPNLFIVVTVSGFVSIILI
mmetsp:Transcript_12681/g.26208  ORF Transcript_12681/g.26208 Transcript_12681/m.26208 type:complete len:363 (+) Transcript_12681:103-1191(+)|eukprot:CAMPEP_0178592504 /NCGR_PEP_ID=MMETSP0697-20121206/29407_1 /TAXON_ID=265572 /ORGANISM="Extubocellulus spinifer, Strain CCMP396" /LENGTH=362 /DNA_ID=CAMNT_0020229535 /DNA_START=175 /DNA_END=1263 /DNA_ORIENTATION=+